MPAKKAARAFRISVGMRMAELRHFSSLHGFEIPSLARAL